MRPRSTSSRLGHGSSAFHGTPAGALIAVGIGLHNFGEGLAIGQAGAAGEISLALALIIGFGLHNATEGFGIVGPMSGESERPELGFLGLLGLIGGGPTFLGDGRREACVNEAISIAFLAVAAGSILYVVQELMNVNRKSGSRCWSPGCSCSGLSLGFATDFVLEVAERPSTPSGAGRALRVSLPARDDACARTYVHVQAPDVEPGAVVPVRLGGARRRGVVVGLEDAPPEGVDAVPIERVEEVPPALVELALWLADYYGSTPGRALALVAPPSDSAEELPQPAERDSLPGEPPQRPDRRPSDAPSSGFRAFEDWRSLPSPRRDGERKDRGLSPGGRGARARARG